MNTEIEGGKMGKEEKIDDMLRKKFPEFYQAKKKTKKAYQLMDKYISGSVETTFTGDVTFPESKQYEMNEASAPMALANMVSSIRKFDNEMERNLNSLKAMWRDGFFDDEEYEIIYEAYTYLWKSLSTLKDLFEYKVKFTTGRNI